MSSVPPNYSEAVQPRGARRSSLGSLPREQESQLLKLIGIHMSSLEKLAEFCTKHNIETPAVGAYAEVHLEMIRASAKSEEQERGPSELQKSVEKLQRNQNRLLRLIFGATTVQGYQNPVVGGGKVRYEPGELVVAVLRIARTPRLPIVLQLVIARNDETSIATLESYSLDETGRWRQITIPKNGTPRESLLSYTHDKEMILGQQRNLLEVAILDASVLGGRNGFPSCFCNPRYGIYFDPHTPAKCLCQRIASSVLIQLEGRVTIGELAGQSIDLTGVPQQQQVNLGLVGNGKRVHWDPSLRSYDDGVYEYSSSQRENSLR